MSSAIETSKRGFLLAALTGAALLGALLLVPGSGQAHRAASPANECEWHPNVNTSWGLSCFEAVGDTHWVQDKERNHWSVRIQIQTDYGKTRWCANTLGAPRWQRCDFNHRETECVRWRMFEQNDVGHTRNWTRWTPYFNTAWGGDTPTGCP